MIDEPLQPGAGPPPSHSKLVYYCKAPDYPTVADGKATALLASYGLMTSVVGLSYRSLDVMLRTATELERVSIIVVLGALGLLVVAGVRNAVVALMLPLPAMRGSLADFREIAARSLEEYRRDMHCLSARQALREMMRYNWCVSDLSRRKFERVELSVRCLSGAFVLWLLFLVRLALAG